MYNQEFWLLIVFKFASPLCKAEQPLHDIGLQEKEQNIKSIYKSCFERTKRQ